MTTVVPVRRSQIQAARLLVKLAGGEDKVEPIIARIANVGNSANGSGPAPSTR